MSDPGLILQIMDAVTIPVMAKCRIGHFVEAQILEALGVDYIDESEVLTPADEAHHIDKHAFKVPFVCGCRNLGEALRRIGEGAAMIRTKGEAGTGDVVEAVRHARAVLGEIRRLQTMADEELMAYAKEIGAPYELVVETRQLGPPAGGQLRRRRHRHPGRRRPDDAARRRRRLRRLRHLQVGRPGPPRQGHRRSHHALQRSRRSWPRSAATWASRWSASASAHLPERRTPGRPRLVASAPTTLDRREPDPPAARRPRPAEDDRAIEALLHRLPVGFTCH